MTALCPTDRPHLASKRLATMQFHTTHLMIVDVLVLTSRINQVCSTYA